MDKKSLLAIALITVVILTLPYYYNLIYDEPIVEETSEPLVEQKNVEELRLLKQMKSFIRIYRHL
jgi:hypothetical protein